MPYLILGIGIAVGLFLILRATGGASFKRIMRVVLLVVGAVGLTAVVVMAAARGGPMAWALLGLLLPAFLRWRAARQFFRNMGGPSPGQSSDVETRFLRMRLDHDTGVLDGTVLEGQYAGSRLGEMELPDLMELLRECRVEDDQSAAILEAYLDRVHGAAWRTGEEAASDAGEGAKRSGSSRWGGGRSRRGNGEMTRDEAYEILGLRPGASEGEIKKAHHRMMQKAHPDRGGSNELASKVNQAKDVLLRR